MGVAEDVGQVGAHGQLKPGVGVPGVLAAFVGVEQMVQTSSPVVSNLLLTSPVRPVQVGHHPLLQGEYVGLISPSCKESTLTSTR